MGGQGAACGSGRGGEGSGGAGSCWSRHPPGDQGGLGLGFAAGGCCQSACVLPPPPHPSLPPWNSGGLPAPLGLRALTHRVSAKPGDLSVRCHGPADVGPPWAGCVLSADCSQVAAGTVCGYSRGRHVGGWGARERRPQHLWSCSISISVGAACSEEKEKRTKTRKTRCSDSAVPERCCASEVRSLTPSEPLSRAASGGRKASLCTPHSPEVFGGHPPGQPA